MNQSLSVQSLLSKVPPVLLLVGLLGGGVSTAYLGWFLYETVVSSVGRGGYAYSLDLPPQAPIKVQDAPFCAQKAMKWVGCF